MLDRLIALDTNLFLWLNSFHSPVWDKIMWVISGKIEWLPLYLAILGYIIYKFRWRSIVIILLLILTITLADQLAVKAFKEVFQRLRPSHNPAIANVVHIVNDYRGGSFGFVSNHAANSFALASFMACFFRRNWFSLSIIAWASLVSYSRIYLGVHYPGDILGGALLGSIIGCSVNYLRIKLEPVLERIYLKKEKG